MKHIFFYLSGFVFLVLTACTDPITVGADLLDGDRAELGQTIDIPFTTRVIRDDSLLVSLANEISTRPVSIGIIEDDVFGKQRNSAYFVPVTPKNSVSGLPTPPAFSYTDREVDSVVMIIPIDTSYGIYGPEQRFPYTARLIDGRVDNDVDYYSDLELPVETAIVNSNPALNPSLGETLLYDTTYSDSTLRSHIRIKLSDDFLVDVNESTSVDFDSDSAFAELIGGLYLEPQEGTNGILTLEPARINITSVSGLYFFFKDTADLDINRFYRAPLSLWPARHERDYAGSLTEELLTAGDDGEQLSLSGQTGSMIEITFTDLEALSNKVINQAEIVFFREMVEGLSYEDYPSPEYVGLYYKDDSGDLQPIIDFDVVTGAGAFDALGGTELFDEDNVPYYRPRFSVHLQGMISGDLPSSIYLRVVPNSRDPSRVILAGPDAAVRPATVRVTFTEIGN